MAKIELNFSNVGRGTQKQWQFVWKIEERLGIKYTGEDDFEEISRWINNHTDYYYHSLLDESLFTFFSDDFPDEDD